MLHRHLLAAALLATAAAAQAPRPASTVPPNRGSTAGINLSWWTFWSSELVFTDAMKGAAPWVTQRWVGGPWNTGEPFPKTATGYPASLNHDQAVATVCLRNDPPGYTAGRYVVLWNGRGEVEVGLDATEVGRGPGRLVADVRPTFEGIMVRIRTTDPSDPVRDLRVVHEADEVTYRRRPFRPAFLRNWERFKVIRFMDWMRANGSPQTVWSGRTTPAHYSQDTDDGVALEHLVELANELHADPWFCLPHAADDDYFRQFARMVRRDLDPELSVYVEYSNECWNPSFLQARYCEEQGLRRGLSANRYEAGLRFYAERSVEMFRIFAAELGGSHRLVRVLAGQNASPYNGAAILDWRSAHREADAFAVAPYFGYDLGNPSRQGEISQMSVRDVLVAAALDIVPNLQHAAEHATNTRRRGLRLLAYEGGQHLVGWGGTEHNRTITDLFIAANRAPEMYWLYTAYLDGWQAIAGDVMAAYHSTERPSKWGSWGALETGGQDPRTAPKYAALLAFIDRYRR